jgi:hypothetical protein
MADDHGYARTSYFQVKDRAAFAAAMARLEVEVVISDEHPEQVALLSNEESGWPTDYWDEDGDTEVEVDLVSLVSEHLADGWVAVFMEVGHQKLRYLFGNAVAINASGETRQVDLTDIYRLAAQLGPSLTHATY